MKQTTSLTVAALLTLSACESVQPPQHGPYFNFGLAENKLKATSPCPSAYACGASVLHVSKTNAFGWEIGAGYRFNRFLAIQLDGEFAIDGDMAHMRESFLHQPDPAETGFYDPASIHSRFNIRPTLRADWPLTQHLSLFGTYGLQLEDNIIHTQGYYTGRQVLTHNPASCSTYTDTNGVKQQICTPAYDAVEPEVGANDYHHRDLRPTASVGLDLYGMDYFSWHVEYVPIRNGRVGTVIIGCSLHL